jgi:hypothetical protein
VTHGIIVKTCDVDSLPLKQSKDIVGFDSPSIKRSAFPSTLISKTQRLPISSLEGRSATTTRFQETAERGQTTEALTASDVARAVAQPVSAITGAVDPV